MRAAAALAVSLTLAVQPARAGAVKPPDFAEEVARHRATLSVTRGALAGPGADWLRAAIDDATFVMLGEDHGIAQVPSLAGALCAELAPHGFHRVALEVGASVAPDLARIAAATDGVAQMKAFDARYPESIAFYDWREDLGFLSSCARSVAAQKSSLDVWGVDQELMGASQRVFDQILDLHPGPDAMTAIQALADEAKADRVDAAKAHDFGRLFLIAVAQPELDAAAAWLGKEGSADAQTAFASLLASRTIYQGQTSDTPYDSNVARAQLMKDAFFGRLSAAAAADKAMPKVLVKLGAWHLYRGMNPLHSSELGNLIAEAAAAHDVEAVNVLVLGVTGKQLAATGPGTQEAVALDLRTAGGPYAFLTPFFAAQVAKQWTIFDLRALRGEYDRFAKQDPEMERLVFGYDFLVLIPDPKPEHAL